MILIIIVLGHTENRRTALVGAVNNIIWSGLEKFSIIAFSLKKDANTLKFYGYPNPDTGEKQVIYGEVNFSTGDVSALTLDDNGEPNGIEVIGNLSELVNGSLENVLDGETVIGRKPVYTFGIELFPPAYVR